MSVAQTWFASRHCGVAQQIRIHPVRRVGPRQVRLLVNRLQTHPPHRALHPLAIEAFALPPEPAGHLPRTEERIRQIGLINEPLQAQVCLRLGSPPVIVAGARQPQQVALPGHGEDGMWTSIMPRRWSTVELASCFF